jgi:hypothetical protein
MADFTVKRYGTDTSGRPIYMTVYMHNFWETVVNEIGFRPTVVQGAFMSRVKGGGADASAGYHDQAGCFDVRTWDLSAAQLNELIRACRKHGGAAWRRDKTTAHGGMDPHCHITLGGDQPYSSGAAASWASYVRGDNGLANNAPDYEWRPDPLVKRFVKPAPALPEMIREAIRAAREAKQQTKRVNQPVRRKGIRAAIQALRDVLRSTR